MYASPSWGAIGQLPLECQSGTMGQRAQLHLSVTHLKDIWCHHCWTFTVCSKYELILCHFGFKLKLWSHNLPLHFLSVYLNFVKITLFHAIKNKNAPVLQYSFVTGLMTYHPHPPHQSSPVTLQGWDSVPASSSPSPTLWCWCSHPLHPGWRYQRQPWTL